MPLCLSCPPVRIWKIRCWIACLRRKNISWWNDRLGTKYKHFDEILLEEFGHDKLKRVEEIMKKEKMEPVSNLLELTRRKSD